MAGRIQGGTVENLSPSNLLPLSHVSCCTTQKLRDQEAEFSFGSLSTDQGRWWCVGFTFDCCRIVALQRSIGHGFPARGSNQPIKTRYGSRRLRGRSWRCTAFAAKPAVCSSV